VQVLHVRLAACLTPAILLNALIVQGLPPRAAQTVTRTGAAALLPLDDAQVRQIAKTGPVEDTLENRKQGK
jgi:hypothetical protein